MTTDRLTYDSGAVLAIVEPFDGHVVAQVSGCSNPDAQPTVEPMFLTIDEARRLGAALVRAANRAVLT